MDRRLLAFKFKVRAVQQGVNESLAGRRLRQSDLVLMMGKDQVNAPRVDVEGVAQIFHAHCRALDVPAGTSLPDLRCPARLAIAMSLPQCEIANVVLRVV